MNRIKVFLINEISESLVHQESTHPAEDGMRPDFRVEELLDRK